MRRPGPHGGLIPPTPASTGLRAARAGSSLTSHSVGIGTAMPNHAQLARPSAAAPVARAGGVTRPAHQAAQLSAVAAQLHGGARQAKLAGLASVVQRVPTIQRADEGDTGADNEGEFYLYEQRRQQRRENEERRERERRENEARQRRQAATRAVNDYSFRFYTRNYERKSGIIAAIINHLHNPARADYGLLLIDRVIDTIGGMALPEELLPAQIIANDNPFRTAVDHAYDLAIRETHAKTDTQLGLHADHFNYK